MKNLNLSLSLFALITLSFASTSHAQLLKLNPATQADPESGYELDMSATESETNKVLTLVGHGVRVEAVPIFGRKDIYLAQFLAETPNALQRDATQQQAVIDSLPGAGTKAIRLTYIYRPIPVNKVRSAFLLSLNNNMTADEQTKYADDTTAFLDTFTASGFSKGTSSTILGYTKADGSEDIAIEDTNGTVTTLSSLKPVVPGFVNKVFMIWLGVTSYDADLQTLKTELLTAPSGLTPKPAQ